MQVRAESCVETGTLVEVAVSEFRCPVVVDSSQQLEAVRHGSFTLDQAGRGSVWSAWFSAFDDGDHTVQMCT